MKKLSVLLFLLVYFKCISQERTNNFSTAFLPRKLSVGASYGFHGSLNNKMNISPSSSNLILINSRYMFKPFFGIFLKGGYDSFNSKFNESSRSKFIQLSLEATYDFGQILNSQSSKDIGDYFNKNNFQLFVHGGPGFASMWNNDFENENAADPYFKNQDDIVLLTFGVNPEYKLNSRVSINFDFSVYFNFSQDRTFNYSIMNSSKNSKMYSIGFGLNYFLGK